MEREEYPSFSGDWLQMLLKRRVVLLCWVQMARDPMLGVVGVMAVADTEEEDAAVVEAVDVISVIMVEGTTTEEVHKIEMGMIISTEEIIVVAMVDTIEVAMIIVTEVIIAVVMVDTTVVLQMGSAKNNNNNNI